jgi:Flp pilus assembly protein TadG
MHTKSPNNGQNGSALIIVAISMIALLGIVGLAVDTGNAVRIKTQMQNAADAAALAGVSSLYNGGTLVTCPGSGTPCTTAKTKATAIATANGFTQNGTNPAVTVNIPPTLATVTSSCPLSAYINQSGVVQVCISQPVNTFFMNVLGISSVPISAAVTASLLTTSLPCALALSSTGTALTMSGNAGITATPPCSIDINSNLSVGGNASLTAGAINVSGTATVTSNGQETPAPTTNATRQADPFANLQLPTPGTCLAAINATGNANIIINPGTYCGGISVSANAEVTVNQGVYILMGGGLSVSGNGEITSNGVGVSFYNTGNTTYTYGTIAISGNATVNLTAPMNGPLSGMLFVQNPLNTKTVAISGNAGDTFNGNMYFPTSELDLSGNSGTITTGLLVANTIVISGNASFNTGRPLPSGTNSGLSGLVE